MKKKLIILGMITALLFTGCSSSKDTDTTLGKIENPDFRNCQWGMSKDEVKTYESFTRIVTEDEKGFMVNTEVNNDDAYISYLFDNDELYTSVVIFNEEHANRNLYIDDYEYYQELLIEKYGEPKTDEEIWKDDLYKDNLDDWGDAIAYGHLRMVSQWFTDTTEIGLMLSGDNYEIKLQIIYQDLNHETEKDTSGV